MPDRIGQIPNSPCLYSMAALETRMRNVRLTEYFVQIKRAPHESWQQPVGWGPYYTASDAASNCERADKLWMAARVSPRVSDARLSDSQIADLRALGQVVAVLGCNDNA